MQRSEPGVIDAGRRWIAGEIGNEEYYAIVHKTNRPYARLRDRLTAMFHVKHREERTS